MICPAIKKVDKLPCTYKAKHNGFCGKHQKIVYKYVFQVPDKFVCKVCLDDNLHSSMVVLCAGNHATCKECVNRGLEIAVGDSKKLCCFDGGCNRELPFENLKMFITDKPLLLAYETFLTMQMITSMNIRDTFSCPFCPNTVIFEEDTPVFYCRDGCKNYSCTKCKKTGHMGECEVDLTHAKDEEATNKFVIKCCGIPFLRGDACNKVCCSKCQKPYCWLCKTDITGESYDHFNSMQIRNKCNLWGDK